MEKECALSEGMVSWPCWAPRGSCDSFTEAEVW